MLGDDPHGAAVGHRRLDVDTAGALCSVGHYGVDERGAEATVDDVLELGVEHGFAVEDHDDIAGRGNVAIVAGEPDRVDLASAGVLGDDATILGDAQARIPAGKAVVVTAGSVEAGELMGAGVGWQFREPVESAVDVPAGGSVTCHTHFRKAYIRRANARHFQSAPNPKTRHDCDSLKFRVNAVEHRRPPIS